MLTIHTLDARDNVLLDVALGPQHGHSGDEIRRQIGLALNDTKAALTRRDIAHEDLRTSLTPQVGRREIAIIFDSAVMDNWYGYEAAEIVIPLLARGANHSILTGDIIWKDQDSALAVLDRFGHFWRRTEVAHVSQLYCVYVNNLSPNGFDTLVEGLRAHAPAVGYVDCTYESPVRSILATCIGTRYVKLGRKFLTSHPDDAGIEANENAPGWPVEKYGYTCQSIDDMSFGLFLRYKIECDFGPYAFHDGHFSLAAAAGIWRDPREIPIAVDDAKREYLAEHKSGSLAKAGLESLSNADLAAQLQDRLGRSYIFNMTWNSELNFSNFATIVEFNHEGRRSRLRAALKYEDDQLGLVTLFG